MTPREKQLEARIELVEQTLAEIMSQIGMAPKEQENFELDIATRHAHLHNDWSLVEAYLKKQHARREHETVQTT